MTLKKLKFTLLLLMQLLVNNTINCMIKEYTNYTDNWDSKSEEEDVVYDMDDIYEPFINKKSILVPHEIIEIFLALKHVSNHSGLNKTIKHLQQDNIIEYNEMQSAVSFALNTLKKNVSDEKYVKYIEDLANYQIALNNQGTVEDFTELAP